MPMQVVVPSVSRAALLQGTALTVFVETPSSSTLAKPTVVPGFSGLPTGGAAPSIGTLLDGAAAAAGGDPVAAGACCCASAGADKRIRPAKTAVFRISYLLKSKDLKSKSSRPEVTNPHVQKLQVEADKLRCKTISRTMPKN